MNNFQKVAMEPEEYSRDTIFKVLQDASEKYYNCEDESELVLTDEEYDTLERYARNLFPAHKYFVGTGSDVRGEKIKIPKGLEMGGLDQLFENETAAWVSRNVLSNEMFILMFKYDGTSAQIVYDDNGDLLMAYSRGRGDAAADITRHMKRIKNVPQKVGGAMVVRCEVIADKKWFYDNQHLLLTKAGTPVKNPRNYVAGRMNSEYANDMFYDNIKVVAYSVVQPRMNKTKEIDLLKKNGFNTVESISVVGKDLNDTYLSALLNEWHTKSPYELDGVVMCVDDKETQETLTADKKESSSFRPAYAKKFKVAQNDNHGQTEVIDIEWNVSKHGVLKPVVIMKPIDLSGVTIQRATAFNAKFVYDNKIGVGSIITVTRSGEVIPKILSVENGKEDFLKPDETIFGTYHWNENEVDLVVDEMNDDTIHIKRIISFMESMEVDFLKDKNIEKLYNGGYDTIEKIINMTPEKAEEVCGTVIAKRGIESLHSKLNPVFEWKLIGSGHWFGGGIGRRKLKELYKVYGTVMNLTVEQIVSVDGFEEKTAMKIVDSYDKVQTFLDNISGKWTPAVEEKTGNKLSGMFFVFTGVRDKLLEEEIAKQGGEVGSSFKKITHLVAKDKNSTSSKAEKAKKANAQIISVDDAWALCKQ